MLLPGVFPVVCVAFFIGWVVIAALIGVIGAAVAFKLAYTILPKTQQVIWMRQGKKAPPGGWPWWVYCSTWFGIGFWVTFAVALYCWAGPLYGLLMILPR